MIYDGVQSSDNHWLANDVEVFGRGRNSLITSVNDQGHLLCNFEICRNANSKEIVRSQIVRVSAEISNFILALFRILFQKKFARKHHIRLFIGNS